MNAPWTPAHHVSIHKTKPVRLLELGTGPHGKTALLEFPEGWQRTIDLPTQADAWHPLFDALPQDEQMRLRDHARPPIIIHADGSRSRAAPLSFVRDALNHRNKFVSYSSFDVPPQHYFDGAVTGYQCAAELLEALMRGYGPGVPLHFVLKEAFEAMKEDYRKQNRRAAASAFLNTVVDALKFFAKHSNHQEWMNRKIAEAEHFRDQEAASKAKRSVEFVQRMKAAKEAKRSKAQRAATGAQQHADA